MYYFTFIIIQIKVGIYEKKLKVKKFEGKGVNFLFYIFMWFINRWKFYKMNENKGIDLRGEIKILG